MCAHRFQSSGTQQSQMQLAIKIYACTPILQYSKWKKRRIEVALSKLYATHNCPLCICFVYAKYGNAHTFFHKRKSSCHHRKAILSLSLFLFGPLIYLQLHYMLIWQLLCRIIEEVAPFVLLPISTWDQNQRQSELGFLATANRRESERERER